MRLLVCLLILGGSASAMVHAKPEKDNAKLFAKRPDYHFLKISPNGELLATAFLDGADTRLMLVKRDSKATKAQTIPGFGSVIDAEWVSSKYLVIVIEDFVDVPQVLMLNVETGETKTLLKNENNIENRRAIIELKSSRSTGDGSLVILKKNLDGPQVVYKLKPGSDSLEQWIELGHPGDKILPGSGMAMELIEEWSKTNYQVSLNFNSENRRKKLFSGNFMEFDGASAFALIENQKKILISRTLDGRASLYKYDISTESVEGPLLKNNQYDIEPQLIYLPNELEPIAAVYEADSMVAHYFNERIAKYMAIVNRSLPNVFNIPVSASSDLRFLVVLSSSDDNPGAYYIFDTVSKSIELVLLKMEWLDGVQLHKMKSISYKSRDGINISGYLSVPPDARNPPLILLVHGGPHARVVSDFDPLTQYLVSIGYAVLSPNYRGSTGYGSAHFHAGFGQVGKKIQDDLYDAVSWAQEQGLGTNGRVCFVGGSFGGYASIKAMIDMPGKFRCAVSFAGFYDVIDLLEADRERTFYPIMLRTYGNPETDLNSLSDISVTENIAKLKEPILIFHGARDERVKIDQAVDLIERLKFVKAKYAAVLKIDEGHSFYKASNVRSMLRGTGEFLQANLPTNEVSNSDNSNGPNAAFEYRLLNDEAEDVIEQIASERRPSRKKMCRTEIGTRLPKCD